MSKIQIAVACHKESVLPKNDLFLPIHVGSALSSKNLNIQRDDEGENISKKNPQYCELTAQYWLWKHSDADYCGLCHYRRFICFRKTNTTNINNRLQIESASITPQAIDYFGLEDSEEMTKIIEKYDAITGMPQKMSHLYTPHGPKSTAMEHWIAHDRALIMKEDLDKMLKILSEVSPDLHKYAIEYLSGKTFTGFNCFVLRRELFNELCEIEFEVLNRLEKIVDLSTYNQQLTRIYGFMAEIISSAYIYRLKQTGKKVKHLPLLYFNHTDPLPSASASTNTIPIVFNFADTKPLFFTTTLQSFLEYADQNTEYELITLFTKITPALVSVFQNMVSDFKNVKLTILDMDFYRKTLLEQYDLLHGTAIYKEGLKKIKLSYRKKFSLLPFVQHFLPNIDKAIVVSENTLFQDSIDELWEESQKTPSIIFAPYDPISLANINDIYPETLEIFAKKYLKNPYNFFSSSVFVLDFAKAREIAPINNILETSILSAKPLELLGRDIVINYFFQDYVSFANQRWCTVEDSSQFLKDRLPYMPFENFKKLQEARKKPGIYVYLETDPWRKDATNLTTPFWNVARNTSLYPLFIQRFDDMSEIITKTEKPPAISKLLSPTSKTRLIATKVAPKGSPQYKLAKSILKRH